MKMDSVSVIDDVRLEVAPHFWINLMPTSPSQKPPFYLSLEIKITNNSKKEITDFSPLAISVYYADSQKDFHDFLLVPVQGTQLKEKISTGESRILRYTNDRSEVFSTAIEKNTELYGRVLINMNEKQHVLTTLPTRVEFVY